MNQKIVTLNGKNAKFLIIHKETASMKISKKIIILTTLKKYKKIMYFILVF